MKNSRKRSAPKIRTGGSIEDISLGAIPATASNSHLGAQGPVAVTGNNGNTNDAAANNNQRVLNLFLAQKTH